jgi:uncharacterized membrane protein YgdD (TMEM256/DUF423 family)
MLENTPWFLLMTALAIVIVLRRVRPENFRQIAWWQFCLGAALFWGSLAGLLLAFAWGRYYSFFADPSFRLLAPLVSLLVYPLWSLLLRWVALRLPVPPAAGFCLLGGLEGLFEHAVAITRLDILQVPMLQGSTPLAVMVFAFFEYIVYWGIALILADGLRRILAPHLLD